MKQPNVYQCINIMQYIYVPLAQAGSSLDSGCVVDFPTETIVNRQTSKSWVSQSQKIKFQNLILPQLSLFSGMPGHVLSNTKN